MRATVSHKTSDLDFMQIRLSRMLNYLIDQQAKAK